MSWSGEISPQAMKVFDNIIKERIAVKPGEQVLIVADTDTELELINALIKAIKNVDGVFTVAIQPNAGWNADDLYALTKPMEKAYIGADVVIAATTASQASVYGRPQEFRAKMTLGGTKRMFCVSERTFDIVASDTADYSEVHRISEQLRKNIIGGIKVRITSVGGTDLIADIPIIKESDSWYRYSHHGYSRIPGEFGNSPDGEVHFPPIYHTIEGTIVVDGPIANVSKLPPDKPVRLDVEKGRIVSIEGGTDADKLKSVIKQYNADYISEIGLGTNPEWKRDLFSAKTLGNLHVAYGGWWGKQDLASIIAERGNERADEAIPCKLHGDMIIRQGTFEIDGKMIVDGTNPDSIILY